MKFSNYNSFFDSSFPSADLAYHVLHDKSTSGKERPWTEKKRKSVLVSSSFHRLGMESKADAIKNCGSLLGFHVSDDSSLILHTANFCRKRLCPLCAWRRSLKVFSQVSKIMDEAVKCNDRSFLFLTLTMRNVNGEELPQAVSTLLSAYSALFRKSIVKKCVLGAFRALEITHNTNKCSHAFNTFHPHLHCILMVNKSYFHKSYITQKQWSYLWKSCLSADYTPIVHIEKVEPSDSNIQKAVAEISKYTVKDNDYLNSDIDLQDYAIFWLDKALAGRRLISFRGEFEKIQKRLNLDDCIDGDLIHVDDDNIRDDLGCTIVFYRWHVGFLNYVELGSDADYKRRVSE